MDNLSKKQIITISLASFFLTGCYTVEDKSAQFDPHYVDETTDALADRHYWSLTDRGRFKMYKYLEAKYLQSQKDIDSLREQNASLQQEIALINNLNHQDNLASNANVERALGFSQSSERVRLQISNTIADLDQQIAALRQQTEQPTSYVQVTTPTPIQLPVQDPNTAFDIAFTFSDEDPWQNSWNMLDEMGEDDKWRGYNEEKGVYFIYMGSYLDANEATSRKSEILEKTGVDPVLIKRPHS